MGRGSSSRGSLLVEEGKGVVSEAPGDRFLRACSLSPAGRWLLGRARAESGAGFIAGFSEQPVRLGAAFNCPRFHAVGAIAHPMGSDQSELRGGQGGEQGSAAIVAWSQAAATAARPAAKLNWRGNLSWTRAAWAMVLRMRS